MRSEWHMYTTSAEAWEAMLEAGERARRSIRYKDYIMNDVVPGKIGRRFVDLFKKKAAEGVSVRVMLDAFGSWKSLLRGVGRELIGAGVDFHWHVATLRRRFPLHFLVRDHRKFMIIDAKTAFIGGVIVEQRASTWRDTHLMIRGPVVKDIGLQYVATWNGIEEFKGPETLLGMDRLPEFTVLASGPGKGHEEITGVLLEQCAHAKRRIYITSPFFVPPSPLLDAILEAAKRRVDIVILLPGKNEDGGTGYLATASYYEVLRSAGIRVLFYHDYLHAKVIIVDDWVTVGSANLDMWSLAYNYEINVATEDPAFLRQALRQFEIDRMHSSEFRPNMLLGNTASEKLWRTWGTLLRPLG